MGGNHLLVTNNTLTVMMTVTIEACDSLHGAHGWVCLPGELGELRGGSVSNLSLLTPVTKRTIGPSFWTHYFRKRKASRQDDTIRKAI